MMLSPNIRDREANDAIAPLAEITQIPRIDFYEEHRLACIIHEEDQKLQVLPKLGKQNKFCKGREQERSINRH
jgi:hypothetical protein